MPIIKLTDEQFKELVDRMIDDPARDSPPTVPEIQIATGLAAGTVYRKLEKAGFLRRLCVVRAPGPIS